MQIVAKTGFQTLLTFNSQTSLSLCAYSPRRFITLKTDNNVFTVSFWCREGAVKTKLFFIGRNSCGAIAMPGSCVGGHVYDQGAVVFMTIAYGQERHAKDISRL